MPPELLLYVEANLEEFSSIVGQIYDAALDPALWPSVLQQICIFVRAACLSLVIENALDPSSTVFYSSYVDPEWVAMYIREYMLINPMRIAMVARVSAGDVVLTSDYMSEAEYARTPIARELLAARGLVDISAAVIEKTATCITVLSAKRSVAEGFGDEALRQKLKLLTPHAQRAVSIGRLLQQRTVEAATFADTLDRLAAPVFLVDEAGAVVHASETARQCVETGLLRLAGGRLSFRDPGAQAEFLEAVAAAKLGVVATSRAARSIALKASCGKDRIAVIIPLTSGARRQVGRSYRAVAAICIKEVDLPQPISLDALVALHKLTRREITVLTATVEHGSAERTAEVLGMSVHTVKTHMKAIFTKTGAKRQTDLVKLMAGIVSPFG